MEDDSILRQLMIQYLYRSMQAQESTDNPMRVPSTPFLTTQLLMGPMDSNPGPGGLLFDMLSETLSHPL